MVEPLSLETRLYEVNQGKHLAMALYLYKYPTYSTIYGIMGPYKNYSNWPKISVHNYFNKVIAKLSKRWFSFPPKSLDLEWLLFKLKTLSRNSSLLCYISSSSKYLDIHEKQSNKFLFWLYSIYGWGLPSSTGG